MSNIDLEHFEANWQKFTTQLRGQIMLAAKKQKMTYPMLKLILADQVGFWDSREKAGGRWLDEYGAANAEKGALIREILVKDMAFTEEFTKTSYDYLLKCIVPVGGAVVGFGVSHALGAVPIIQAVATIVPAAVGLPVANSLAETMQDQLKKEAIGFYLAQLEKYKLSVERILED